MSLFSSSPAAKGAAIGAIVVATAGAGVTFLTGNTPPLEPAVQTLVSAAPPASTAPEVPAPAAREVPAPAVSQASVPVLEVTTLTQTAPGKTPAPRRFPFVSSADASVAARINNLLFINTFEVPAPARASDGLREVSAAMWQQRPEIDFKVQRNDGRIFSVTLASEGCGAYCESYTTAYAFDAASGRHLGAQDLFSAAGQAALTKETKTASLAAIKAEIGRLKSEGAKGGGSAQGLSAQEHATAIQMYEECAQQRQSSEPESALDTLQIQAQAVTLTTERCSNHAMRALDALGEFSASFSPEQLKPWLSAYGRHLLLDEASSAAAPASPWGQVLRGQIGGKLPVTMALGFVRSDDSVNAQYFYDRHRKPITVVGNFQGGTLTLTETGSKDASPPRMVLKPNGSELRGRWEGQTTLDAVLAP
jgi:hypothetical protein